MPIEFVLRLFIAGRTPQATEAIENLESICAQELAGRYRIEIVDVIDEPRTADEAHVFATPTLIKQLPPPLRRVIGDLSDRQKVLVGLDLLPADGRAPAS